MDALQKLLFQRAAVRGETVVLHDEFSRSVEHQHLPLAVRRLAGEVTASALLAAAALEFDGTVLLQIAGDGPIKLLVAEVRPGLLFRVSVTMREDAGEISADAGMTELVNAGGRGRCALILDQTGRDPDTQPYQGVVSLAGETFAEAMTNYFATSEQVETKIKLASDESGVGGLMLQKMPLLGGRPFPRTSTRKAGSVSRSSPTPSRAKSFSRSIPKRSTAVSSGRNPRTSRSKPGPNSNAAAPTKACGA